MTERWPRVPLGEVFALAREAHAVDRSSSYPNVGIYSFGRGVLRKPPIEGRATSANTLYQIHPGQFIYSRLFAFEGAYGIVPENCDGCFVSNEFPTFNCDRKRIIPEYLGWMFRYPAIWKDIAARSIGIGHRRQRVHPEQLLEHVISLPPVSEQERIVARIEGVAVRLREAQALRDREQEENSFLAHSIQSQQVPHERR